MVIFGASGDLTKRKLIPALHNLVIEHLLPSDFAVIGISRTEMSDDDFRQKTKEDLREFATGDVDEKTVEWLLPRLSYVTGELQEPATFEKLGSRLKEADERWGTKGCYLFYLAIPPSQFEIAVQQLGESGLAKEAEDKWRRVVIEKPFGHDLESARALNRSILTVLDERQIYRIDHYLGKETVQNILAFRFANGIFEPVWNRRYVDHVQITVAETVGVEERGPYYEEAGALRDMVQNHLFQLLAIVAMEPPISFAAESVRDERVKVLCAIKPLTPEDVLHQAVRGQYGEGEMEGERVPAYRDEPRVKKDSAVETFVALELFVESWRWAGVPFYLRTGKHLPKRVTEIAVIFKPAPQRLFQQVGGAAEPNALVMQIQPDEGISIRFVAKAPGQQIRLRSVEMDFSYGASFGVESADAYERLLLDAMLGDSTLFTRRDEVEAAWSLITPILDAYDHRFDEELPTYPAGTWGPEEATALIQQDGRRWRRL
jgi:glucose-6-phosphate 1-dehydrogenase